MTIRIGQLRILGFSVLNAFVMLVLTIYWLSLPRTFGDEAFFIKWTSLVKKSLLGVDQKPDPGSILYVDISGSKSLMEVPDPLYEERTGFQYSVITNRGDLALFLDYVKSYGANIPIVILDMVFEEQSKDDSLLQTAIDHCPFPIVGARRLLANGKLGNEAIHLPTGIATYLSTDNQFMKYPLFLEDTLASLPLVALKYASHHFFDRNWFWPRIDYHPSLVNPIVDFKIRPIDLRNKTYMIRSLGTLLFEWESVWLEPDIRRILDGKTIIIGDFKDDIHSTVFGSMPGPIIVHNALLTLANGESLIDWRWLVLLFALFFWMSWRIYKQERRGARSKWWHESKTAFGKIIADSIDDTFFLIIGTILSYFLFNIHINILVLLIYLKIITYLLKQFVFKNPGVKK